jgi:hypothetical protein
MKVKSISYIHSFNCGQFLNDKIGIEVELNENDHVDEVFEQAKSKVHQWAKEIQDGVSDAECGISPNWDKLPSVPIEKIIPHPNG